jgi:predicted SAM-dependent methyltransferase
MNKRFLNLGCGDRFHPEWENVDFVGTGPSVRVHNLRRPTPYADETFDVVYHSHVLEHFPRQQALPFLRECYRVLRPAGVIRVAVPDLERIARLYLEALEKAANGVPGWADNYEWMVMEMYDQCVREGPSNAFTEYLKRDPVPNSDFVLQRWGAYAIPFLEAARQSNPAALRNPGTVLRDKILRMIIGQKYWEAIRVGRFRRKGEIHMWMYDRYSLSKLLQLAGFTQVQQVGPAESRIPGWAAFHLDTEPDGRTYKADSIYMEACKP